MDQAFYPNIYNHNLHISSQYKIIMRVTMTLEYLLRQIYVIYSIIIAKENSLELYPRQSKNFTTKRTKT